ncbi:SMP-30/gluconolactonase/LRE family protein [Caballeronia sp. LZ035]|uniref:SMP-30/gluconolactonase/LRE family protein n=1 Tax=Caballeronia sp. LZ035 TaxID=3038568 RepID=UPI002865C67C|nr:SMP-30/gluconolactonase/LRE family protein [Caballeronia sp. LZ035]MDR5756076.1 SMP-30/gluconolactonase/LRE family protein [Caballeronia sp. LZ035]
MPNAYPVPRDFRVRFEDLGRVAIGVKRPECVLSLADGSLVCSHGAGGYSLVSPSGGLQHIVKRADDERTFLPNGIAVHPDGRILFAHLGVRDGGIHAIDREGSVRHVVDHVDGKPLPPTNYVSVTDTGGIWFTVSTRQIPRSLAWNRTVADGFIGFHDSSGTRIVADGLGYTNEIAFSPDGRWVYVNETYAQRVSRFRMNANGSLSDKEVVAQFGGADLPDGLTFDEHGGVWVTCIGSNRILLIRPDGEVQVVLDEPDDRFAAKVAAGIQNGTLTWEDMQGPPGNAPLGNVSSLAFGGLNQRTACLGSLTSDCIWTFPSPVTGAEPGHFRRRVM